MATTNMPYWIRSICEIFFVVINYLNFEVLFLADLAEGADDADMINSHLRNLLS